MPTAVLIWLDAFPAHLLGCYGSSAGCTPNIDRLASQAVVFDRCFARFVPPTPVFPDVDGRFGNCNVSDFFEGIHHLKTNGSTQSVALHSPGVSSSNAEGQLARIDEAIGELARTFLEQPANNSDPSTPTIIFGASAGAFEIGKIDRPNSLSESKRLISTQAAQAPLMIRYPDEKAGGKRIQDFVTPNDALSFFADLSQKSGVHAPHSINRMVTYRIAVTCRDSPSFAVTRAENGAVALRTETACLMMGAEFDSSEKRELFLFRKPEDLWERNDVADQSSEEVEELKCQLLSELGTPNEDSER